MPNSVAALLFLMLSATSLLSTFSAMHQRHLEREAILNSPSLMTRFGDALRAGADISGEIESIDFAGAVISDEGRSRYRYRIQSGECTLEAYVSERASAALASDSGRFAVTMDPSFRCR